MIKEYDWYITSNRFSEIVEQLDSSIREYGDSIINNEVGDENLREKARLLCEEHLVKSGMRSKGNSFINIDLEFFDNGRLEEDKLNSFLKDVVKSHAFQKVLWEYMGTTGLMTSISKDKMKNDKFNYLDYLPVEIKNQEIERNKNTLTRNFNKLNDDSGFNWNASYDPNYNVEKKGWYTCYDENGYWTYYRNDEISRKEKKTNKTETESIKIIKTEKGCMIYDSGNILLNPVIRWYTNNENDIYGGEESDTIRIIDEIKDVMKSLEVEKITEISVPESENKSIDIYKKIFGTLVDEEIKLVDSSVGKKLYNESVSDSKISVIKKETDLLEHKINSILSANPDATMKIITSALESGKTEINLNVFDENDSKKAFLSEEEYSLIINLCKSLDEESALIFANNCLKLSSNWFNYSSCGKTKIECIKLLFEYYKEKKNSGFSYELLLKDIIVRSLKNNSIIYSKLNNRDYFIKELNQIIEKLPSENQEYAIEYINSIPEQNPDVSIDVFSNLYNAIANYSVIRSSTGISLRELFDYSIKSAKGSLPKASIQPPVIGYITPNMQNAVQKDFLGNKVVYFDINIELLCNEIQQMPFLKKEISVLELENRYDEASKDKPVLIIGRSNPNQKEEMIYDFEGEILNPSVLLLLKTLIQKAENNETQLVNISKDDCKRKIIEIARKSDTQDEFIDTLKKEFNVKLDLSIPENRRLYANLNDSLNSEILDEMAMEFEEKAQKINYVNVCKNEYFSNINTIFSQLTVEEIKNDKRLPDGINVMTSKHSSLGGIEKVNVFTERKYYEYEGLKYIINENEFKCLSSLSNEEKKEVRVIIESMSKKSVEEMLSYFNNDWTVITPLLLKEYLWRRSNSMPLNNIVDEVFEISSNKMVEVSSCSEDYLLINDRLNTFSPILKDYINKKSGKKIFNDIDIKSNTESERFNNIYLNNFSSNLISPVYSSFKDCNIPSGNLNLSNDFNIISGSSRVGVSGFNSGISGNQNINKPVSINISGSNTQHVSVDVPFTMDSSLLNRNNNSYISNDGLMNSIPVFNSRMNNSFDGFDNMGSMNINRMNSFNDTIGYNIQGNSSYNNKLSQNNNEVFASKSENRNSMSPEEKRLSKMNANYEHDKTILAKKDPLFAKNEFWDVGHAKGSDDLTNRDLENIAGKKSKVEFCGDNE